MLTLKAFLPKVQNNEGNITNNHIPCGYMFYAGSKYDEYKFKPVFYRGENAVYIFLNDILKVADKISCILKSRMIKSKKMN